ncbi:MAG: polysaccharide deacetylase family protein [Candidatus Nanopelagicales bacterium]
MRRTTASSARVRAGLLTLLVVGAITATVSPSVAETPAHRGADSAQQLVTVRDGVVRWRVVLPDRSPRRDLLRADPCLTISKDSAADAPTQVCLTSRDRARVRRPDGSRFVVPVGLRRGPGTSWVVRIRQADLALTSGSSTATAVCDTGRCVAGNGGLDVPRLRMASCRARAPWLVHEGSPDVGRAVALTFDDGPGPSTRPVLRVLRRAGVLGTFFQVGRMIAADPGILPRMARAGHVIGNHSYTHPVLTGGDTRELRRTTRAIVAAGVPTPCAFRAPYGDNPTDVIRMARDQRMVTVHWNTDPGDWRGLSADQIVATTLAQARPRSIMVFHDGEHHPGMVAALPRIISGLEERGYRFLTVPELLRLPVHYQ